MIWSSFLIIPTHSFSFNDKQIASLSKTVHFLIDFMETYDSHGCTREAAEVMESRIAYAAHAAHDVIESHIVDQIHAGSTLAEKVRSYFLLDLQKTIDNLALVNREAMQFKAKSGLKAEQPTYSAQPASSEPLNSGKNVMVGLEAVAFRLMDMFIRRPPSPLVIPIVGMGGMGKTTLAKYVYEHSLIKQHFDVRLWATISQEYSAESILTQLFSEERKSTSGGDVSVLGEQLHKKLWGRRYLIVLDDMWSEGAWDKIRMFLPDDGNGSCVIVTTRLSNLAAHLSSSPFEMNFLDNDESWQLFCGKAFGEEDCPVELEEIGKKIAKRCRGLPLSIVVIGGHLKRSHRSSEYWEKVANYINPISSLAEDEQRLNIIRLSYDHLPAWLKPCFLYMGMLPEDAMIRASNLFEFWVAEGFIKPNKSQSLEEIAEDYLEDLIDRNLILVYERRWNGKVMRCGVHDIMRELSLKVGKREKFVCVVDSDTITRGGIGCREHRRIMIPKWKKLDTDTVGAVASAPLLRSLVLVRRGIWQWGRLSVDPRLLRISVNVNNMYLKEDDSCCPTHFHQVNLRYLAFCIESLAPPRFIPTTFLLWNLQTLIIDSNSLDTAPCEIWEMLQIRRLHVAQDIILNTPPPVDRSKQQDWKVLRNLHTFTGGESFRVTEEACRRIPNIKDLELTYMNFPDHHCGPTSYYCLHNLGRFNKLESLMCHFGADSRCRDVVRSITLPTSLESLYLLNSHLHWDHITMMIKSLPRLGFLKLFSVRGPEWNLVEDDFPSLKELHIYRCHDLIYLNANSSYFPALKILNIYEAPKLRDFGEIPTLRLIELNYCSVSVAVSAMRIVVEQESLGNEGLQVNVEFFDRKETKRFQKMVQQQGLSSNNVRLK